MKIRDLKYLLAYLIPISAYLALELQSYWSFSTVILAFVFIPILEFVSKPNPQNASKEVEDARNMNRFFDFLLYLNIPIIYFLTYKSIVTIEAGVSSVTYLGLLLNLGIVLGTAGINVGHEIGHRKGMLNKIAAALLLSPSFYGHFTIEHNYGHHKWVATPDDPVTAKYNQSIYAFIVSAVIGVYTSAWKIAFRGLQRKGLSKWSLRNELIWITLFQLLLFASFFVVGQWQGLVFCVLAAIASFSLLETIDYVEHYGLQRKRLSSGKYEQVSELHSWNSDHEIGRIFLYELTRHTDHHMNAARKFQTLRHMEGSPQLPFGYPSSIILALIPPIWFKTMNPRLKALQS